MNTITQCGMTNPFTGHFRTSWCDLVGGKCHTHDILHLYYKFAWLQDEIEKRSSYLGKFRRTEEAQHLLELLAMTKDESDLFFPFARAAMADVFDFLHQYTPNVEKAYLFNEGVPTKKISLLPKNVSAGTSIITSDITERTEGADILMHDTTIHGVSDLSPYTIRLGFRVSFDTWCEVKETGTPIHFEREEIIYKDFNGSSFTSNVIPSYTLNFRPELSPGTDTTTHELFGDCACEVESAKLVFRNPQTFQAGDWLVDDEGTLYKAIEDGNTNNASMLEEQPHDFRRSIHYILHYPDELNRNMVEPLDTAIFEALINRILMKWLMLSYPQEAELYAAQYAEACEQIRKRFTRTNAFIKRIPRIF